MNKDKAMQMLKAKLYLLKQEENAAKEAGIRGEVKEIGWGCLLYTSMHIIHIFECEQKNNCFVKFW